MKPLQLRNAWVLVTGASSGLGQTMARQLARDYHANLIVTARRLERLEALRDELTDAHGIEVVCIPADLSVEADVERLFEEATTGREVYGVILNAGTTHYNTFVETPPEQVRTMIDTNLTSLVRLTQLFVPYLIEKGTGGVLLVSSMASIMPAMPYQAIYGGTKAFVTSFGCALSHELKAARTGVSLTVFTPGGIKTELLEKYDLGEKFNPDSFTIMPVEPCARVALKAWHKRKRMQIAGWPNHVGAWLARVLPRRMLTTLLANAFKKPE